MIKRLSLAFRNQIDELTTVASQFEEFGKSSGLSDKLINSIQICLDELISNSIFYGYPEGIAGIIQLQISLSENELEIIIDDDAREYDPRNAPAPDLTSDIESRRKGGLGVHIVKNMMDVFDYKRENNRNIIILRKKI